MDRMKIYYIIFRWKTTIFSMLGGWGFILNRYYAPDRTFRWYLYERLIFFLFSGNLCGLCGNFNAVPRDDMTTKNGQVVLDPQLFGSSWRVGGKNSCSRSLKPVTQAYPCSRKGPRIRERMCKPLRQRTFAACHKKLNPVNFFRLVL